MVMTIDIPDAAVAQAKARGIEVEELLKETFGRVTSPASTITPAEAVEGIRRMRGTFKLPEGVTLSQLMEQSRKF